AAAGEDLAAHARRGAMIPAAFEYIAPTSLDDALDALRTADGDAKLLAGGHSLVPLMKLRLAAPSLLVDLGRGPGVRWIAASAGGRGIGARTTHAEIEKSAAVREAAPALAEAAHQIGDRQVRARGTLGGSITHADPAADLPAVMLALGATMILRSPSGTRE